MLIGLSEEGDRIRAEPGESASCPLCDTTLIPKCGQIKKWHWAHSTKQDCDEWYESETPWHLGMKEYFVSQGYDIEVVFERDGKKHIADAFKHDTVVEIQHSSISFDDIKERCEFYSFDSRINNVNWVFDAREFNFIPVQRDGYYTYRWKWPRKSLSALFDPNPIYGSVFFYLGNGIIFEVKKAHFETPSGGWGDFIVREALKDYIDCDNGIHEECVNHLTFNFCHLDGQDNYCHVENCTEESPFCRYRS